MKQNRIIALGLEEHAHKLRAKGLTYNEIAKELSKIAQKKITPATVWRYFNQNSDKVLNKVKHREEVLKKALNDRIDAAQQLIQLNNETLLILQEAKKKGDLKTALKAIARLEKQLELHAKLLGDIVPQKVIIVRWEDDRDSEDSV